MISLFKIFAAFGFLITAIIVFCASILLLFKWYHRNGPPQT